MRRAAARALPFRYRVVIASADDHMRLAAQSSLRSDYDLFLPALHEEVPKLLREGTWDAIFLDLDTVYERTDSAIYALAELRTTQPAVVLFAFTRSNSRELRLKAIDAAVDEYFVAPLNFDEVRIVLARTLSGERPRWKLATGPVTTSNDSLAGS